MVFLFSLAVVLAVGVLIWALRPSPANSAIRSNLDVAWKPVRAASSGPAGSRERLEAGLVPIAAGAARKLMPKGQMEQLERRIAAAGLGSRWPLERVLAAKAGCVVVAGILGLLWAFGAPSIGRFVLVVVLMAGTFLVPDLVIGGRADERRNLITRELPDVIDQVVICVEAGLGFDAALSRVAEIGKGPMAEEFGRMLQEVRFGLSRGEALESMSERVDVPDVRHVTGSLRQADAYGIPILDVLKVVAAELRDSREQRAEEAAQKVPVKLLFPLVFCIFPALLIVLLGPAFIRINGINFG